MRKPRDIDVPFLYGVFTRRYPYILPFAIACALVVYVYYVYVEKPVYQVYFSLFAWDYYAMQTNVGVEGMRNEGSRFVITDPLRDAQTIGQDLQIADKMLSDYEKILESLYVNNRVQEKLELEYPHLILRNIPYQKKFNLSRQTHFIDCYFYSVSPEMAQAAAMITNDVFMETVNSHLGFSKIKSFDKPILLPRPVNKHPLLKAGVTFAFSFSFLFGSFIFLAMLCDHITSTQQVVRDLQIPLLGTLIRLKRRKNHRKDSTNSIPNDKTTYNFNNFYEDFQIFITNLQYVTGEKDAAHILMVTSSTPHEGKSLLSSYLSILLAEKEMRVLMIHADIRKGGDSNYFGIDNSAGLTELIVGEKTFDEVVHRNINGRSLDVISAGATHSNPLRLIEIFTESGFIESLEKDYDYIIIDTPPASILADALVLGKLVDDIIIVANARKTSPGTLKALVTRLRNLNLNITGIILNQFSSSGSGYGYGYGYGYDYGYGYGYGHGYGHGYDYDYNDDYGYDYDYGHTEREKGMKRIRSTQHRDNFHRRQSRNTPSGFRQVSHRSLPRHSFPGKKTKRNSNSKQPETCPDPHTERNRKRK